MYISFFKERYDDENEVQNNDMCITFSNKKKEKGKVGKTLAQVSMRINNDLYYMEVFVSTRVEKINIGVDVVAKHSKIVKNNENQ